MTDIISKPFDWNDNFSEVAQEDFSMIQKSLSYCTCQNIGMALAKLELLEKQGCKVIDPSGSSSEKPKSEWEQDHEILKAYSDGANDVIDKIRAKIEELAKPNEFGGRGNGKSVRYGLCKALEIIDKYKAERGE